MKETREANIREYSDEELRRWIEHFSYVYYNPRSLFFGEEDVLKRLRQHEQEEDVRNERKHRMLMMKLSDRAFSFCDALLSACFPRVRFFEKNFEEGNRLGLKCYVLYRGFDHIIDFIFNLDLDWQYERNQLYYQVILVHEAFMKEQQKG